MSKKVLIFIGIINVLAFIGGGIYLIVWTTTKSEENAQIKSTNRSLSVNYSGFELGETNETQISCGVSLTNTKRQVSNLSVIPVSSNLPILKKIRTDHNLTTFFYERGFPVMKIIDQDWT